MLSGWGTSWALRGDEGSNEVGLGSDRQWCWLVDRWMSPLQRRKEPLRSLIASDADVRRVLWTAELDYVEFGWWNAGKVIKTRSALVGR